LQIVPGFEFKKHRTGFISIGIRGVKDQRGSAKMLLLIDGVPYNTLMYGISFFQGFENNMDAVERVEIIRGPGSALYGRNAFSAVVNVITKSGKDNEGLTVTSSAGNFGTTKESIAYGVNNEDYSVYANIAKFDSDGAEPEFVNPIGGETATVKLYHDAWYVNLKANLKDFYFTGDLNYLDGGTTVGPNITDSDNERIRGSYSLGYKHSFSDNLKFSVKTIFQHKKRIQDYEILKSGVISAYPNGQYVKPEHKEYKYGFETEVVYQFAEKHNLLTGIQLEKYGITNADISSNYNLTTGEPYTYVENGETLYNGRNNMVEWPEGWIEDHGHDYYNLAFYLQDTYYPFENFGITLGARYDYDSEFGSVISPKGGLVWEFVKNANLKLLYGQAFKAPTCEQQYKLSGFALRGSDELDPETIKTYEIGLGYGYKKFAVNLNGFYNIIDDLIKANTGLDTNNPAPVINIGKNTSKGIEIETKFRHSKDLSMFLNYSFVVSEDEDKALRDDQVVTQTTDHIDISAHKINFGFNYSFMKYFNLNSTVIYRGEKEMENAAQFDPDNTDIGDAYMLLNTTLLAREFYKTLGVSFSVYNVLDESYYDYGGQTQDAAGKYVNPQAPGRSFVFKVSYKF